MQSINQKMNGELYLEYRSRAAKLIFDLMKSQENLLQTNKVIIFSHNKAYLLDPIELDSFILNDNTICFEICASRISVLKFRLITHK